MNKFCLLWGLMMIGALKLYAINEKDTAFVNTLLRQSSSLQRSNVDLCYLLASQALTLSEKINYQKGIARANNQLSAAMMIKGDNDSSLLYANRALSISLASDDHSGAYFAALLIGYVYENKGQPERTIQYFYQSLFESKKTNDSNAILKVYNALGAFYMDYEEYAKSKLYYNLAIQLAQKTNNESDLSDAILGVGSIYYKQGKYKVALQYYLKVDSLSKMIGEVTGVAQNQNNIALCYAGLNQKEKALYYYQLALTTYKKHGMKSEEANLYYNVGCLYNDLKESDSAIFYFNKSLSLATVIGEPSKAAENLDFLAALYAQKGQFETAYNYHLQYSILSDSILNKEKISSISEMQTKYETELKEQEIVHLNEQNESKTNQRNGFIVGMFLMVLLAGSVFVGLTKTRKAKKISENLLLNILPSEVADELKKTGGAVAKQYNHVTVLFTDFVNFTGISEQMSPTELVAEIHQNFTAFDAIIERNGLEKIKTIGDAYLAVCGLPNEVSDHAQRVIKAAMEITQYMQTNKGKFQIRVGVNSGPVVAGIVGVKKYAYDIWGDTVNTAARMEQHSEAGKINISGETYMLVKDYFSCEYRGKITAKNKGEVDMYFVNQ